MSSENSTWFLVACDVGLRVVGCRRSGKFAKRAAKDGCGSPADVHSEEFLHWEVEQFANALALRSLRAVPGVWRLMVREQVDNNNAERFSRQGSWSFQTRIPQRTHAQLYEIMCGVLTSIHKIWAPPAQWAELEVPLEAAERGGAFILADDRLGQQGVVCGSAGIILESHVATVARQAYPDTPAWA